VEVLVTRTLDIDSPEQQELMRVCNRLRVSIEEAIREMVALGMDVYDVGEAVNETVVQAEWPEEIYD
jgi:hypothetical protein